jgi:hypothetical protein
MRIPFTARSTVQLHEPDTTLHQPSAQQAQTTIGRGLFIVDAIQVQSLSRFVAHVDRFRCFGLHAKGEFIAGDACLQFRLFRMLPGIAVVEPIDQPELRSAFGTDLKQSWPGGRLGGACCDFPRRTVSFSGDRAKAVLFAGENVCRRNKTCSSQRGQRIPFGRDSYRTSYDIINQVEPS